MDELDFNNYFDKDKEEIKLLLNQTKALIEECKEVLALDPDESVIIKKHQLEVERYRALKLALVACDDNSILSTINFEDYGTLDVNKVYDKMNNRFDFNFSKEKPMCATPRKLRSTQINFNTNTYIDPTHDDSLSDSELIITPRMSD
jgi:hypothetical protein